MGVVNATPDSFSDGGQHLDAAAAIARGRAHVAAGAAVVDVGAESTRPGARPVGADEERARLLPVVAGLHEALTRAGAAAAISVDTYKAEVADAALAAGAEIVNDVSGGLLDPEILKVAARRGAAIVLGHLRGTPETMRGLASYNDVVSEVREELRERVARAVEAGVPRARVLVDPGLGFAKTGAHNLALLARLDALVADGLPVVVGASRKAFLGELTGRPPVEREVATAAAHTAAILAGATLVRVHDVALQRDAVVVAAAIRAARAGGRPS
jgi:dihydropteroate synthase